MKLDFTTLFVVILLNSVGFAIVWAVISVSYRSLHAARYWFAALAMTCLSGPALLLGESSRFWNYSGNLLVVFSFGLLWQGARVFFNRPPLWRTLHLLLLASALSMIALGANRQADNVIFAVSQMIPMGMAIFTLMTAGRRQTGTWIAASACALLMLGQGSEAATNMLRLAGVMSAETYYEYASWFLACAIIGASVLNLGFLLMAVDRLRSELHHLATRDELTGLPNRRAMAERLTLIEKRAKRLQQDVSVLMMDLDRFKQINDDYGHPAGDAALRHVASVAAKTLREADFLARIGGDEFCILLTDADLETASQIAGRLAESVSATPFYWRGVQAPLAASIGVNHWNPASGTHLADSLTDADDDLLRTKRDSRDHGPPSAARR